MDELFETVTAVKPQWRGPEHLIDDRRQFIRENMPSGKEGFVAEDLDLVIKYFGSNFSTDRDGFIKIIELKVGIGIFGTAQKETMGLLDKMCRTSEYSERYLGFFLVYSPSCEWEKEEFITVNGFDLSQNEFKQWLLKQKHIEPIEPRYIPKEVSKWHR